MNYYNSLIINYKFEEISSNSTYFPKGLKKLKDCPEKIYILRK